MSTNAKPHTVDLADIVRDPEGAAGIIFDLMRERDDWRTQATQRADTMHALVNRLLATKAQRDKLRSILSALSEAGLLEREVNYPCASESAKEAAREACQ
jgi:hypothetical protein